MECGFFTADIDNVRVDTLAAALAESMNIPDSEREELQRRNKAATGASTDE